MYEMPVPLYIAMKIHAVTCNISICVSYDHFLRLTSDISSALSEQFNNDGVVSPPKLRSSLFTTAAVDNIDCNPSSTTLKDSFHGTGISIIQHPSHAFQGHRCEGLVLNQKSTSYLLLPFHQVTQMYHQPLSSPRSLKYLGLQCPCTTFQTVAAAKEAEVEWFQTLMVELLKQQNGLDIMVCILCKCSRSNGSTFSN